MSSKEDTEVMGCLGFAAVVFIVTTIVFAVLLDMKSKELGVLKERIVGLQEAMASRAPQTAEADPRIPELEHQLAEARSRQVWSPVEALQNELRSHQNEILILHKKIDGIKIGSGAHCNCARQ